MTAPTSSFRSRLTSGTADIDIVGRRKIWYIGFAVVLLACIGSMLIRGFNPGIDFAGGTQIQMSATGAGGAITTEQVDAVFEETVGRAPTTVQTVGTGDSAGILLRSTALTEPERIALTQALFEAFQPLGLDGQPDRGAISDTLVSSSWGAGITQQALTALAVFLVLVTIFLALYFEPLMAAAALVTLASNIVITAGIYSMIGIQVTPTTIVGLLAILGFSLYDTVVVFDKVRENTRGTIKLSRRTYGESANLALNQTLMRSINTTIISSLPVLGLLVIGVGLLGVGTLADLAVVYLIGVVIDTFSSIFLATPLLVDMKMRQPQWQEQAERVRLRRAHARAKATGEPVAEPDPGDVPAEEPRGERAMAAASGVPARVGRPPGERRPSGRAAARPTGKRRR